MIQLLGLEPDLLIKWLQPSVLGADESLQGGGKGWIEKERKDEHLN